MLTVEIEISMLKLVEIIFHLMKILIRIERLPSATLDTRLVRQFFKRKQNDAQVLKQFQQQLSAKHAEEITAKLKQALKLRALILPITKAPDPLSLFKPGVVPSVTQYNNAALLMDRMYRDLS